MADEDVNRSVVIITDLQAKDWLQPPRERTRRHGRRGPRPRRRRRRPAAAQAPRRRCCGAPPGAHHRRRRHETGATWPSSTIENRTEPGSVRRPPAAARRDGRQLRRAAGRRGAQLEVRVDDGDAQAQLPGARPRRRPTRACACRKPGARDRAGRPAARHVRPTRARTPCDVAVMPPRDGSRRRRPRALQRALAGACDVRRRVHVLAWSADQPHASSDMDAELYLRGIYEGDAPGEGGATLDGGLPPIYRYHAATSESATAGAASRDRGRDPVDLVVLANVEPRDDARGRRAARRTCAKAAACSSSPATSDHAEALNDAFYTQDARARASCRSRSSRRGAQARRRRRAEALPARPRVPGRPASAGRAVHERARPTTGSSACRRAIWGRMAFRSRRPEPTARRRLGRHGRAAAADRGRRPALRGRGRRRAARRGRRHASARDARSGSARASTTAGWRRPVLLPAGLPRGSRDVPHAPGRGRPQPRRRRHPARRGAGRGRARCGSCRPAAAPSLPRAARRGRRTPAASSTSHDGVGRSGIWRLTYERPVGHAASPRQVVEAFAVNPDAARGVAAARGAEAPCATACPGSSTSRSCRRSATSSTELEEAREGEITRFAALRCSWPSCCSSPCSR